MHRIAATILASLLAFGLVSCAPEHDPEHGKDHEDRGLIVPAAF